jgi:hypothetical protein
LRQKKFVKNMDCHQGRTIRNRRRRKTPTPAVEMVGAILTKSTKFDHSTGEMLALKAEIAGGSILKASKAKPEKCALVMTSLSMKLAGASLNMR